MTGSSISAVRKAAPWLIRLMAGAFVYGLRRSTPAYAYQSLIQLFCITSGRSNDLLAQCVSFLRRPYKLPSPKGVLGELSTSDVAKISQTVKRQGYYLFPVRLPRDLCERLLCLALSGKCIIRPTDADTRAGRGQRVAVYDRNAPEGIVYEFDPGDLVNNEDIQGLMADPSLIAVAQAYLGSRPVLDEVNLWWSTAFRREADGNAAQLYHFDMDRIRWLKFFIYLTEVGPDNGPHCFVAGSHRTGAIPNRFLQRGYARLPDHEVRATYPADAFVEFTGPIGTIFAEDTRGLHKGKPVSYGDRLVLEFEFSNSMFGATPHKVSRIRKPVHPSLRDFVARYRRIYGRWLDHRR